MPQQTVTFTLSFPVNSLIQVTTTSLPAGLDAVLASENGKSH